MLICVHCGRLLCEDFISRELMTGDSNRHCRDSPDGKHHLE